ncbi:MAG: RNA chaperone Hfq [Oscillospiraceae bacterium]|jgi:host factor-I protein|nr:RNA chaperone Hfq [Oscillospiraceae bacterium]
MPKEINLQDVFLNQARKEHIPVTVYITNGFQFKGIIRGFDSYVIILDVDGKQNLIYKHAISTITPLKNITVFDPFDKNEDGGDD